MNEQSHQKTNQPQQASSPWAFQIARIAGIPVRIHFTFLLLLGWFAWFEASQGRNPVVEVLFIVGIFLCVLLHEFGHALTARRYGIRTRDIVLYPIGGVARVESLGKPNQEFWIALAGPMVNVVLAAVIWLGLTVTGIGAMPTGTTLDDENFVRRLLMVNIVLALFNLIPAFPMDGGRILRAILAGRLGQERGTIIAARIGQLFAILFFIGGLFLGNFILMFVGVFIFLGATGEGIAQAPVQHAIDGKHVRDAMITRFETLTHGQTLGDAADALLNTYQQDFPVLIGDRVLGVLSQEKLLHGLARDGRAAYVSEAMNRNFGRVSPDDDLQSVLMHFSNSKEPVLVFENEKLVGLLTVENIGEFILVRQSLARSERTI